MNADKDVLIEHYKINADLYKNYLDLLIKFNISFYAITGAILSFYFYKPEIGVIKYSLLFPFFMSFIFGCFFIYASKLVKFSSDDIGKTCNALGLDTFPEFSVLSVLLKLFAAIFFFTSIFLLLLFIFSICKCV